MVVTRVEYDMWVSPGLGMVCVVVAKVEYDMCGCCQCTV